MGHAGTRPIRPIERSLRAPPGPPHDHRRSVPGLGDRSRVPRFLDRRMQRHRLPGVLLGDAPADSVFAIRTIRMRVLRRHVAGQCETGPGPLRGPVRHHNLRRRRLQKPPRRRMAGRALSRRRLSPVRASGGIPARRAPVPVSRILDSAGGNGAPDRTRHAAMAEHRRPRRPLAARAHRHQTQIFPVPRIREPTLLGRPEFPAANNMHTTGARR
jgi:hypothetical protein